MVPKEHLAGSEFLTLMTRECCWHLVGRGQRGLLYAHPPSPTPVSVYPYIPTPLLIAKERKEEHTWWLQRNCFLRDLIVTIACQVPPWFLPKRKLDNRFVYSLYHLGTQFSECVQHWLLRLPFASRLGSPPAELCCCCLSVGWNTPCSSRHRRVC